MRNRSVLVMLVFSILLGLSPLAADTVIRRGVDIFTTPADGRTYYDFAKMAIPAGFFCKGSKAFTGRIAFKGLPLSTQKPGQLWGSDTIVERLDDAAFDAQGTAVTRLQLKALSLVSIAPIKTSCGAFHAYISLNGKQRITRMRITRTEEGGGTFAAPLAVDARLTFLPVKTVKAKSARKLELTGSFTFPTSSHPWSLGDESKIKKLGAVMVDTDGDLTPDSPLPGASNFFAGVPPEKVGLFAGACSCCPSEYPVYECHSNDGHNHCYLAPACTNSPSCC